MNVYIGSAKGDAKEQKNISYKTNFHLERNKNKADKIVNKTAPYSNTSPQDGEYILWIPVLLRRSWNRVG